MTIDAKHSGSRTSSRSATAEGKRSISSGGQTIRAGKITKVTFTCEVPEYWRTLFQPEPNVVVHLYRQLTGNSSIVKADLMSGGAYNKNNLWNTTKGMVHLTVDQLANTLDAALGLARGSAAIRHERGTLP